MYDLQREGGGGTGTGTGNANRPHQGYLVMPNSAMTTALRIGLGLCTTLLSRDQSDKTLVERRVGQRQCEGRA